MVSNPGQIVINHFGLPLSHYGPIESLKNFDGELSSLTTCDSVYSAFVSHSNPMLNIYLVIRSQTI